MLEWVAMHLVGWGSVNDLNPIPSLRTVLSLPITVDSLAVEGESIDILAS
jgi:hypothetical protein